MNHCFVFGAPRSGTTYLLQCLSRLRETECKIGAGLLPVAVLHLVNQDLSPERYRALCGILESGISNYLASEYNSRFRALGDWWRAPLQWRRLHHVVRRGSRPQPEWFVYKEPFLSLAPEFIFESITDAKAIYIYRDGRDVANSLVESYDVLTDQDLAHLQSAEMRLGRPHVDRYVPWWVAEGREDEFLDSSPYVRAIWMWSYMVLRCRRYFQERDVEEKVLQVQYETFVQEPHRVGSKILKHLELERTHAFRRHLDRARTTSIGKHRHRAQEEIEAGREVAEKALSKLGYT